MHPRDWILRFGQRFGRQQVALILLWLGCPAVYGWGYRAQWSRFVQARASMAPLSQEIEKHTALIEAYPNADEELTSLRQRFQRVKETSLGTEAIPRAIQQLAQAAVAAGVTLESIGPRDDVKAPAGRLPPGVGKRTIEVRLIGSYQAVGEFFSKLEELATRYTVDRLVIRGEQKDLPGLVRVELFLGTYGLL